jgi:hypothetical protein
MESGRCVVSKVAILGVALLVFLTLLAMGCSPQVGGGTASEAKRAFERLYEGYTVSSVVPSGTAWLVNATITPDQNKLYGGEEYESPAPQADVRIAMTRNGMGSHTVVVNGVTWTANADLQALLRTHEDDDGSLAPLFDGVTSDLEETGSVISDVKATTDTVGISYTGPGGQKWSASYRWERSSDDDMSEWVGDYTYPVETWKQQVKLLRQIVQAFGLSKGIPQDPTASSSETSWIAQAKAMGDVIQKYGPSAPAEPRETRPPRAGRFMARILSVDRIARTITIDRFQVFFGSAARKAAAKNGTTAFDDYFYTRNRVKERTVLPLSDSVAFTTYQAVRPWQPNLGGAYFTALNESDFMTQYRDTAMKYAGAWIAVSGGHVTAVIGNYSE